MFWLAVVLLTYFAIGLTAWRLIARSSRPRGAAWAIILWPLWFIPRSS